MLTTCQQLGAPVSAVDEHTIFVTKVEVEALVSENRREPHQQMHVSVSDHYTRFNSH